MKKYKVLLSFFAALLLCAAVLPFAASANTELDSQTANQKMQAAFTYEGMQMRLPGDKSGLRSNWQVDHATVSELEAAGYTVTYGVIMGVAEVNGNVIRTDTDDLLVTPHATKGYAVTGQNSALVVVYETGSPSYASNLYTGKSGTRRQFTYTTIYSGAYESELYYDLTMAYRGFYVLQRGSDAPIYGYVDKDDTGSALPKLVSLTDVASFFYKTYDGPNAEIYRNNRAVLRVVAHKESAVSVYGTGSAVETLADGSYKLPADSNTNSTSAVNLPDAANTLTLKATVPARGYYRVIAKVNRENTFVKGILTRKVKIGADGVATNQNYTDNNPPTYIYSQYTLGTDKDVTNANPTYLTEGAESITIGYLHLTKGENVFTVSSSAVIGISDITLEIQGLPVDLESGETIIWGARTYKESSSITSLIPYGSLLNSSAGYATYAVTPTVSGIYTAAMIGRVNKAVPVITVTDTAGNVAQQVTTHLGESGVYPPLSYNRYNCGNYVPFDGEVKLQAGVTYHVTVTVPSGELGFTNIILQKIGEYNPDALSYTPKKSGMHEFSVNAPACDSYTLLLNGKEIAHLDGDAGNTAISLRSFGSFYLEAGRVQRLTLLKNGALTTVEVLRGEFTGERGDNFVDITLANGSFVYERDYSVTVTSGGSYTFRLTHSAEAFGTVAYTISLFDAVIKEGVLSIEKGTEATEDDEAMMLAAGAYSIHLSGTAVSSLTSVVLLPPSGDKYYSTLQGTTDVTFVAADGVSTPRLSTVSAESKADFFGYHQKRDPSLVVNYDAFPYIPVPTATSVRALKVTGQGTTQTALSGDALTNKKTIGIRFTTTAAGTYSLNILYTQSGSGGARVSNFRYTLVEGTGAAPADSDNSTDWVSTPDKIPVTSNADNFNTILSYELISAQELKANTTYTFYFANVYGYNPEVWGIYLDLADVAPITATPVGEARATEFEAPITVNEAGQYRLTLSVNAGTATSVTAWVTPEDEALGEGVTVDGVTGNATLLFPDPFPIFYGKTYTLRLSLGGAELHKASFDFGGSFITSVWYSDRPSDLTGYPIKDNNYNQVDYVPQCTPDEVYLMHFGMPAASPQLRVYPGYDAFATPITVPATGDYMLRLLYEHGGTSASATPYISVYFDGEWTASSDATEAANKQGGAWSVGTNGVALVENKSLKTPSVQNYIDVVSYDIPLRTYAAGEHTVWIQTHSGWPLFLYGIQLIPLSSDMEYEPYKQEYFAGQSTLFMGDSITQATGAEATDVPYRGWAGRIGIATGMQIYNRGVSGATLSTVKTNRIISQYVYGQNYDYVIFNGGINDATSGVSIGTITAEGTVILDANGKKAIGIEKADGTQELFDTATFAGALEELFATIINDAPNTKLGYIINHSVPSYRTSDATFMTYIETAIAICEKWNVPYLNLHDDSAFATDILKTHTTIYLYDYLHPNTSGYDIMYKYIMVWMEALPPHSEVTEETDLGTMPTELTLPE